MSHAFVISSTSPSEGNAISRASTSKPASTARSSVASAPPPPKLRSCAVCRTRRVRCDKQSPCSNCRKAGIACVVPSSDRPPRWARKFERLPNAASVSNPPAGPHDADPGITNFVNRIRNLENLVKDLRSQLESAHAEDHAGSVGSSGVDNSDGSPQHDSAQHQGDAPYGTDASGVRKQFGRMVLQDASHSRYVSSGFWSEVNDELDVLRMETRALAGRESDSSEEEDMPLSTKTQSNKELERTPFDRHSFLFQHNLSLSAPDAKNFHPLPSQIPFLLDIFSENVNIFLQVVHMPTITKMVRGMRGSSITQLSPANEALMFSIYYAAVTSMEDDDIMTNFGISKSDLNLKYRMGMENALARADFLNAPDLVIVQALSIFLCLGRRHDSPRFVWMMIGLVIRMAQYLGLQRDGSHFEYLTPFEIEMRRRTWWLVCGLDMRASEDQATDISIAVGSFDTKFPRNINDTDIGPETKEIPEDREGVTDMTYVRVSSEMCDIMRRMVAPGAQTGPASLEHQRHLLDKLYETCEQGYFKYMKDTGEIIYWVAVTLTGLIKAKMTLLVFLPILFASPGEHMSDQTRTMLLVSAMEVAEYNHELNDEQACRHWRWLYQTCTHWHAIVYILIEIHRRQWSPLAERGWIALHSNWLIPATAPVHKYLRIWVPLRKLVAKIAKHRDVELARLRADPLAATRLEMEDEAYPVPSSSGQFRAGNSRDIIRKRWRQLVGLPDQTETYAQFPIPSVVEHPKTFAAALEPLYTSTGVQSSNHALVSPDIGDGKPPIASSTFIEPRFIPAAYSLQTVPPVIPASNIDDNDVGYGVVPWLWADFNPSGSLFSDLNTDLPDVNMDTDEDMNWHTWIESALGVERGSGVEVL